MALIFQGWNERNAAGETADGLAWNCGFFFFFLVVHTCFKVEFAYVVSVVSSRLHTSMRVRD